MLQALYASKTAHFAIQQDPFELFRESGKPEMYALGDEVADLVMERISKSSSSEIMARYESCKAHTYLTLAICQYIEIVAPHFTKYKNLTDSVTDPRTHQAIAYLAMRPEDSLTQLAASNERLVESGEGYLWGPAIDGDYLELADTTIDVHRFRRCPYAGRRVSVPEKASPLPLFSRFCSWTGQLAILSYEHHGSVMPNFLPDMHD